jgi:hypothetical protein
MRNIRGWLVVGNNDGILVKYVLVKARDVDKMWSMVGSDQS